MSKLTLQDLVDASPLARERYYGRGYKVPTLFLSMIEGIRPRREEELTYDHFLDQVALESLSSSEPWHLGSRNKLHQDQQSSYLNYLESVASNDPISLDPNFNQFAKMDVDERMKIVETLQRAKQDEFNAFRKNPKLPLFPKNTTNVNAFLITAKWLGYEPVEGTRRSSDFIELRPTFVSTKLVHRLFLADLPSLKSKGNLFLQYSFPEITQKRIGLDTFIPDAVTYCLQNRMPSDIALSFCAQRLFIDDLDWAIANRGQIPS